MGSSFLGKAYIPECLGLCFQKGGTYMTSFNSIPTACKINFIRATNILEYTSDRRSLSNWLWFVLKYGIYSIYEGKGIVELIGLL